MTYSHWAVITNIVASSLFAFFGTFGNILVIIAFFSVRSLRTINNIFVVQLACVDLLKASFTLVVKSVNQAKQATSIADGFCEITGMSRAICSCQSAILLATIAVVRYFKVVKSREFRRVFSLKRTFIYCAIICGGTFLLALLPVFGLGQYSYSQSHGACFVTWAKINIPFRSIYYFVNVGISLPVLIFCYLKIFKKLQDHSRAVTPRIARKTKRSTAPKVEVTRASDGIKMNSGELNQIETKEPSVGGSEKESATIESDRSKNYGQQMAICDESTRRANKKKVRIKAAGNWFRVKRERSDVEIEVTRVMFAIVVAYIVCWIPAAIVNILNLSKVVAISGDVLLLIVTLVDLKVCINPMIYGIGSKQFRNAFIHVLLRKPEDTVSVSGVGNPSLTPSLSNSNIADEN